MSNFIAAVLALTFIITFIGTLGYAVRIVGVRTGRIAVSFALFNVLMLVSRTATTFQAPLLAGYVEKGNSDAVLQTFYFVILVAGIASVVGALAIPTFQRVFSRAVESFAVTRSVPRMLLHVFSRAGVRYLRDCVRIPEAGHISRMNIRRLPKRLICLNTFAVALLTVSVLAPVYAGMLIPDLRMTCVTLSGVINGLATLLLFILIDPYLSILTDDVMEGKCSQSDFRVCIVGMVGSKIAGTFAALLLLVPAAQVVALAARAVAAVSH